MITSRSDRSVARAKRGALTGAFASALALACIALATPALQAQDAPPPQLPRASAPPTPPAATVAPVLPPANAVALCNDQSFVLAPALPAACATRGGLKLVLPTFRSAPPAANAPGTRAPELRAEAPAPTSHTPPAGATMRCKDGTWLFGAPSAGRCASNGGLAVILPPAPSVPPAPRP